MVEATDINSRQVKRAAFADFWPGFDPHDNILSAVLTERLGMTVVDDQDQADFLIYSVFGEKHQNFKGIRVFYTGESVKPRWDECDYAISFMKGDIPYPECHLRMPCWMNNGPVRRTGKIEQYSKDRKSSVQAYPILQLCVFQWECSGKNSFPAPAFPVQACRLRRDGHEQHGLLRSG